jgi:hypothetical protein
MKTMNKATLYLASSLMLASTAGTPAMAYDGTGVPTVANGPTPLITTTIVTAPDLVIPPLNVPPLNTPSLAAPSLNTASYNSEGDRRREWDRHHWDKQAQAGLPNGAASDPNGPHAKDSDRWHNNGQYGNSATATIGNSSTTGNNGSSYVATSGGIAANATLSSSSGAPSAGTYTGVAQTALPTIDTVANSGSHFNPGGTTHPNFNPAGNHVVMTVVHR